jgi:hypothetical protein
MHDQACYSLNQLVIGKHSMDMYKSCITNVIGAAVTGNMKTGNLHNSMSWHHGISLT